MTYLRAPDCTAEGLGTSATDARLCGRISAEFLEMPGLVLTLAQAARLFNIECGECQRALRALVSAGLLRSDGRVYVLADSGRRCA
jgi:hypothetical protein